MNGTLGACVRKGEKGWTVCYADSFIPKDERERTSKDGGDPQSIPFLKRYTVFNIAQCDGLPDNVSPISHLGSGPIKSLADQLVS